MAINESMKNAEPQNLTNSQEESDRNKFSALVLFACILSVGSLAYTTWSFLDLNKINAVKIEQLGGISLIGLSAAAAMDVFWTATMVAEYRGRKVMARFGPRVDPKNSKSPRTRINILPHIGWLEVLAIAAMLGYHGKEEGGWAAAFTAILPIATKFVWTLALDDIRDPSDLTEDEKEQVAEERRAARLAKAKSDASADKHAAELEQIRREKEAELEELRAANTAELEKAQVEADKRRIDQQSKFELEKAELEGEAEVEIMRNGLKNRIAIERFNGNNELELARLDAERNWRIASIGMNNPRMIQGETVVDRPQISQGEPTPFDGLKEADRKRADLASRYYVADHVEGGITKAAFCAANNVNPPRLSEATTAFPIEWFVENGLAYWR